MDIDTHDQYQEREKIKNTQNPPPKVGDTYHLITQKWWNHWKSFVYYENREDPVEFLETSPPPIDNTDLLENGVLKPGLLENENYALLSSSSWDALKNWYGGGPDIPRRMIEVGESKTLQVEVYLLQLVVLIPDAPNPHRKIEMSRGAKVIELIKNVAAIVYTPPHNCHVKVDSTGSGTEWKLLTENLKEACLQEVGIIDGTLLFGSTDPKTDIAELQAHVSLLSSGKFLSEDNDSEDEGFSEEEMEEAPSFNSKRSYSSIYTNSTNNYSLRSRDGFGQSKEPGVTGLSNLGNTCFMNSALQCLSNTQQLTNYFISGNYQKDINRGNPLGTGGRLAEEYGKLMKKMWKGGFNCVSPSDFKWAVGRHAPQFEGYRQHDSQELLSYLLDGLHEDLNRVRDKPYIPLKDSDNRPDRELATEAWQAHLERNKSIVVDLFHGQLKSTVVCPDPTCNHISITFDPFVYLSLPLPMSYDRYVDLVYVVPDPLKRPRRYRVTIDKRGTIHDLKCALFKQLHSQNQDTPPSPESSTAPGEVQTGPQDPQDPQDLPTSPEDLVVADVYRSNIYKIRLDKNPVEDITLNDVTFVYLLGSFRCVPPVHAYDGPESGGRRAEGGVLGGESRDLIRINIAAYHCIQEYMFPYEQLGIPKVISILVPKDRNVAISYLYEVFSYHFAGESPNVARVDVANIFLIGKATYNGITKLPYKNDEMLFIKEDDKFSILWKTKQDYEKRNPLMKIIENDVSMSYSVEEDGSRMSLDDCLKKFHEAEKLGKSDEWFCSRCRKFQQATKKFDLWKTPPILVIHLKRFQYTKSTRNKINTYVDFPLYQLDLTKYQLDEDKRANPPVYDLYAVSVHSGGLGGGHYTAYGLNALQNKWYCFNDSSVVACQPNAVKTSGAYVLFYKRRDREDGVVLPAVTTTMTRDGVRPMDFVKD